MDPKDDEAGVVTAEAAAPPEATVKEWWEMSNVATVATAATTTTTTTRKDDDDDNDGNGEEERRKVNCSMNGGTPLPLLRVRSPSPPHQSTAAVPLLDLRSQDSYKQRRLRGHVAAATDASSTSDSIRTTSTITTTRDSRIRTIVHIPLSELRTRSYELPPRSTPMVILVDDDDDDDHSSSLDTALEILQGPAPRHNNNNNNNNNNSEKKEDEDATATACRHRRRKRGRHVRGWKLLGVVFGNREATWNYARELGILIEGEEEEEATRQEGCCCYYYPYPRLWEPDALIQRVLLPLLLQKVLVVVDEHNSNNNNNNNNHTYLEINDLGAGSGRDVAFLAEELKRNYCCVSSPPSGTAATSTATTEIQYPFKVIAIDQRYRGDKHQQQITEFMERRGVDDVTDCRSIDFNQSDRVNEWLSSLSTSSSQQQQAITKSIRTTKPRMKIIKCFYGVRFWHKPLVESILKMSQDASNQDTTFIFAASHFGKARPNQTEWNFKHPKPQNVLERYELRDMFVQKQQQQQQQQQEASSVQLSLSQWKILHDEVVRDNDHGRTLIQFVAQQRVRSND